MDGGAGVIPPPFHSPCIMTRKRMTERKKGSSGLLSNRVPCIVPYLIIGYYITWPYKVELRHLGPSNRGGGKRKKNLEKIIDRNQMSCWKRYQLWGCKRVGSLTSIQLIGSRYSLSLSLSPFGDSLPGLCAEWKCAIGLSRMTDSPRLVKWQSCLGGRFAALKNGRSLRPSFYRVHRIKCLPKGGVR